MSDQSNAAAERSAHAAHGAGAVTDIVERLRICAGGPGDARTVVICRLTRDTARDAAAEIERLQAEIERLKSTAPTGLEYRGG